MLSRGYGRHGHAPARVRLGGIAEEFGDEPLLIAQEAGVPVYVAPQRYDAGFMAEAHHSDDYAQGLHLLDDGFQHRGLARDIDILLLNLQDWEDSLLPAGNLREPLSAIRRASVVAIPTNEPDLENKLKTWGWQGPVWRFHRRMDTPPVDRPGCRLLRNCPSGAVLRGAEICRTVSCRPGRLSRSPLLYGPRHQATALLRAQSRGQGTHDYSERSDPAWSPCCPDSSRDAAQVRPASNPDR